MPGMRIGPYEIVPKVLLAPMAGVTDKPFRVLCKRLGAGTVCVGNDQQRPAVLEDFQITCIAWTTSANPRRSACRSPAPCRP